MTRTFIELKKLPNRAILSRVDELVRRERRVQAALIANLSELDRRRLYLDAGCRSFYVYCVERLGYSESAAYRRMQAARAARRFPDLIEWLAEGRVNLTTVALLAKHLTMANHRELLMAAAGKSRTQVEALIARTRGDAAAMPRSTVRVVQVVPVVAPAPAPQGGGVGGSSHRETEEVLPGGDAEAPTLGPDITESISAGGSDCVGIAPPVSASATAQTADACAVAPSPTLAYRHAITLTAEEHADLERARELLRTLVPNGDPARVIGRALRQLVVALEARKFGAVMKPRAPRSAPTRPTRTIPAEVRRAVTTRDAGRCTHVAADGHRCTARDTLEFHHRTPFSKAGPTTPDNVTLLCAAHHRRETEREFGAVGQFRRERVTSAGGSAARKLQRRGQSPCSTPARGPTTQRVPRKVPPEAPSRRGTDESEHMLT
jgi:hypothetical protein